MPQDVDVQLAREYWLALLGNVAQLIDDAVGLAEQSPGLAWSLIILAQEELGKASRVYDLAAEVWTKGSGVVTLTDDFLAMEKHHQTKLVRSFEYGEGLDMFWGDFARLVDEYETFGTPEWERAQETKKDAIKAKAKDYNLRKQSGFYVDRTGGIVKSPSDLDVGGLFDEVRTTAAVAEMLLITDHSRMKIEAPGRYESTSDLQRRFLMYAHPDEFFQLVG